MRQEGGEGGGGDTYMGSMCDYNWVHHAIGWCYDSMQVNCHEKRFFTFFKLAAMHHCIKYKNPCKCDICKCYFAVNECRHLYTVITPMFY